MSQNTANINLSQPLGLAEDMASFIILHLQSEDQIE